MHEPARHPADSSQKTLEELEAIVVQLRADNDGLRGEVESARERLTGPSEAYFRMAPDIVCMLDKEARITSINYTGPGLTLEEVVGRSAYDFVTPEERPEVRRAIQRALHEGKTAEYETRYHHSEHECVWYDVRVGPLRDGEEEKEIVGAILIARDITLRKQAEEKARRRHQWFELLAKASPSIVFRTDAEGNAVFVNNRWEEITGLAEGSWVGQGWAAALHEEDRPTVVESWRRTVTDRSHWRHEFRFRHVDGDHVWVTALASPIRDATGQVTGFIGTCTDITDLKNAQEELQRAQSQLEERVEQRTAELTASEEAYRQQVRILQSILDNLADGVMVADKQGKFLLFNPAARRLTGLDGIDGDPQQWPVRYGLYLPDGKTLVPPGEDALSLAIRGKRIRNAVIKIDNRTTGQPVWVSANASPLIDDEGNIQGGTVVIRDISEQKQAERAIQEEQRMLKRLLDFQERERKLISHEIHDGFLQDIVGAKMMIDAVCTALESEQSNRTASLLHAHNLLDKAITEGRRMISELRPMVIDEQGIVEAIEFLVADESAKPLLDIQFSHPPSIERLDPMLEGALFRIVQEALNNARRHSQC
ncbi:MAG: PAS domain S-box protein, partial [Pirellulales bacterium]